MIPLIFLALAISAAAAAYGLSPRAHEWVDDHVRAIRGALAAHHAADIKLDAAQAAVDVHAATQGVPTDSWGDQPGAGAPPASVPVPSAAQGDALLRHAWDSLQAAAQANAAAAAHTIAALKTAKTDQQKTVATQSSVAVDARQQRIEAAKARLGSGECDVKTYRVTAQIKDALLAKLHSKGMTVTGDDPWDIDTHEHGVKLRAVWDPRAQELKLIVTSKDFGVPCFMIWLEIDPILKGLIGG